MISHCELVRFTMSGRHHYLGMYEVETTTVGERISHG